MLSKSHKTNNMYAYVVGESTVYICSVALSVTVT